jgi:plastocyanin
MLKYVSVLRSGVRMRGEGTKRLAAISAMALLMALSAVCNSITDEELPPPNHIWMEATTFKPETLEVNPGAVVTWTNAAAVNHTSTSGVDGTPDSIWNSGPVPPGDSFARKFATSGTYPYYCQFHVAVGMKGYVVVRRTSAFNTDSLDTFVVQWLPNADSNLIHFRVSAPSTGWVSIGFNSMPRMEGSNIIIGYVVNDTACIQDNYGSGGWSHEPDIVAGGVDNITDKSGSEGGGRTELRFTIPLNSGDARDYALELDRTYSLILAYGPNGSDDFTSLHEKYEMATIRI